MSVNLQLDQMTTAEKLQAMEALWDDLTQNPEEFASPAWHETVLHEREARLRTGQETPLDWENVKKELRDRLK